MKVLQILRSEPDEMVRIFVQEISRGKESQEFPLFEGDVDYDKLIEDIFECKRVICWW